MLTLPPSVRIFLRLEPTDMRKSFDTLAALVRSCLGQDPLSGHLFIFRNKRGDRLKVLYWDKDGYALWQKRLEKGTFTLPAHGGSISRAQLMLLLEGYDHAKIMAANRYELPHLS